MHEKDIQPCYTNGKTLASCFFLFQGIASIVWWYLMFSDDRLRSVFFGSFPLEAVKAFVGPDAIFYVVGSFVCAWAVSKNARYRNAALSLMTGGCGYATILTIGLACNLNTGWVGPSLMLASFASIVLLTLSLSRRGLDK
jgi:hypothetical protein